MTPGEGPDRKGPPQGLGAYLFHLNQNLDHRPAQRPVCRFAGRVPLSSAAPLRRDLK